MKGRNGEGAGVPVVATVMGDVGKVGGEGGRGKSRYVEADESKDGRGPAEENTQLSDQTVSISLLQC